MGKYAASKRMSRQEQEDLFIDFAKALSSVKNPVESANFIQDLLSEAEVVMLARRLQVARLLLDGCTYEEIEKEMKVSNTTIAKVQTWLNLYGDGYRTIVERTKDKTEPENNEPLSWSKAKKKYPMYFWPELLLKQIVKSANKREREKLLKVVGALKEKTKLSKELKKILSSNKSYHTQ
jgi:TrpR-related protein YerC/YecD